MRAFLALELPVEVRTALADLQRELAQAQADVKWVELPNLHVTLRFLGEITEAQRLQVQNLLTQVAGRFQPIQVRVDTIGAFPSLSAPRVVWVGIEQGREPLEQLAEQVEAGLAAQGFPRADHPFQAHVTLGRARSPRHRARLVACLQQTGWKAPPPCVVSGLTFFQSTLTSSGPRYTALATIPFSLRAQEPTA